MSLRPSARTEVRRNRYKVAVDADEGRRRREDNMVEIRKNKREESLLKKRREGLQAQQFPAAPLSTSNVVKKLESLPSMVAGVWSDDGNLQLEATTQFRKLLSIERSPPIEEVIQAGVVSRFVEFLAREDFPQLQFEAAWALTNIASGTSENTKVVIDHGAVPIFVKLLGSPSDDVREQAVWALGNVAGDSPKCRDLVLRHGALIPLLAQLNEHAKLSMLRNATWTLSNFCRGKPQPPFEQVRPALPALERLVHSTDEEILTDSCWALSYLSDGTDDQIQAVIEAGVCPRLVELFLHPSPSVLVPALRTVGNIVTGDDIQTQCIINTGALPCLLSLLTHNHKKSIKKEACWTISNITAGNKEQIQAVIEAGLIGPLVNLLQNAEFDIKKEAAWAGCIKPLCDLLVCPDPRIVTVSLEGLENILKVGEAEKNLGNSGDANFYAQMIDDAEGLEKIENLQSHDNNEIYEKAVKILETYWLEEDDETLPSGDGAQQGFQFGGNDVQESVVWNGEAVGRGDKYVVVKLGRWSKRCITGQSILQRPNKKGVRKASMWIVWVRVSRMGHSYNGGKCKRQLGGLEDLTREGKESDESYDLFPYLFDTHWRNWAGLSSDLKLRGCLFIMLDPYEKQGSESEEMSSSKSLETENTQKKTCADCGTSKTPLWRGGPAGPKSLCNACGIRSRKKKRDVLGLSKGGGAAANDKRAKKGSSNNGSGDYNNDNRQLGDGLKQRLLALGRDVLVQRSTVEKRRRKLGEEEQAAVLLMALSYGSVYA
uniref:GATA-type domain-containing protein n=2 Tax=Salix TaxID=40685 RepID=A0A6N2MW74_SALVM